MTIHVHVASRRGYSKHSAFHFLSEDHLTSQARAWCEAESKVKHIILLVSWFRKGLIKAFFEDKVARGTS